MREVDPALLSDEELIAKLERWAAARERRNAKLARGDTTVGTALLKEAARRLGPVFETNVNSKTKSCRFCGTTFDEPSYYTAQEQGFDTVGDGCDRCLPLIEGLEVPAGD